MVSRGGHGSCGEQACGPIAPASCSDFTLATTMLGGLYHPRFTAEELNAQRGWLISPEPHRK